MFVGWCLLSFVVYFFVRCLLFDAACSLLIVGCGCVLLFVVCCPSCSVFVSCVWFVGCCSLVVVRCLLFVVCCVSLFFLLLVMRCLSLVD